MLIFTFFASWVILGWIVFFAALPFGVKPERDPLLGNDPGAPARPQLFNKALISGIISGIIMGAIFIMIKLGWIDFFAYFGGGNNNSGSNGLR